jgi:hypothetical protein
LILVATALRLVVATCFGAGNDEAYHELFARHLDWSYFDHPPMLALVVWAGLAVVGFHASVFALRLGFVILFAGSTWLMARLTARHYGPEAGWIAAFALNATAYYGVAAATFALPDGPLVFFWLLTLDRLLVALEEPERVSPWLWVGLAWGGALLSKYQAVFLPVATLAYLAFEPAARHWLRRPGPYLAFALGLLVFAPVLSWNAHHGWASFAFQGGRALGWPEIRPDRFAAFLGGQAAYLFPWIWVPLIVVLFREVRRRRGRTDEDIPGRFLLYQAAVPLLAFGGVALVQPVLPHWSLVGFLAAFPLLGRAWAQWREAAPARFRVRLVIVGFLTIALSALVVSQAETGFLQRGGRFGLGLIPVANDPTLDSYGWDQVSRELETRGLLNQPEVFLFSDRWYYSGHLALATDQRIPVACYNRNHAQNFAYWSDPRDWVGRDGIFVGINDCEPVVRDVSRWFRRFEPLATIPILRNGVRIRVVHLYRGIHQMVPFPFGNTRKPAPQRLGTAALGTPQFGWLRRAPSGKIPLEHPRLNEVCNGCKQRQLQGMKQTMWKHQRSVRNCSPGVEDLEDRFLLSGGGSLSRGIPLLVPAVQVASEPKALDSPEDEPPYSPAARTDDDPPDPGDLTVARTAATSSARTAPTTTSDAGAPGGPIVVIRTGSDIGAVVVSTAATLPAASVATPVVNPPSLPVTGSLGGDRPNGVLVSEEGPVERLEPGLPAATRVRPFGSPTRALRAANAFPLADSTAAGSAAIAPPRGFGLIGETLPFARTSLEQALARFLSRIEGLGVGRSSGQESPASWIPWLVLTVAAGAGAAALRRRSRADDGDCKDATILQGRIGRHGLPGVPDPR